MGHPEFDVMLFTNLILLFLQFEAPF